MKFLVFTSFIFLSSLSFGQESANDAVTGIFLNSEEAGVLVALAIIILIYSLHALKYADEIGITNNNYIFQ